MILDILMLLAGLALLVLGGNWVTDSGSSIARRLHMSGLLVGLTIVAFGSATPDLAISVMSTIEGKSQMAIGDVLGANIFDLLLVVGILALIKPIKASKETLGSDFPVAALAALILFFLADDVLIDGDSANILNRSDGLVMLSALGIFMVYTISTQKKAAATTTTTTQTPSAAKEMPVWRAVVMILVGFGALVLGGNWFVDGASGIAYKYGWSEALVGLTIVAIGSSLPDLATSVVAVVKHQPGIALGNIIGGCIFNILLVLGTCSVISPLHAGTISQVDFLTLVGAAMAVWLLAALTKSHTINRWMGALLVLAYLGYMDYLIVRG